MNWIPGAWDEELFDNSHSDKERGIIPDGTEVNFYVHSCIEKNKSFKNQLVRVWSLQLICESEHLSNLVFHDVWKDGYIWNERSKPTENKPNGEPWIQQRFVNLCSAVSLRPSGSQERPNPAWFTDPALFLGKRGRVKIVVETYNNEARNVINWFKEPTKEQAEKNKLINDRVFNTPPPPPQAKPMPNPFNDDDFV